MDGSRLDPIARAYEAIAADYGWSIPQCRATLSYEQFYLYLHAAEDRLRRAAERHFDEAVESVRVGYIIARDKKALRKWRSSRRSSGRQTGLSGQALERAMSQILALHPEFLKGYKRPPHLQPRALRGKTTKRKG